MTTIDDTIAAATFELDEPELNLYREVHKGLRRSLFDLCAKAGTLGDDPAELAAFTDRFDAVDRLLTLHHGHEDGTEFAGLIARSAPEYLPRVHDAHERIVDDLAGLRAMVAGLGTSASADAVYDGICSFVADYLAHMATEEHEVMPAVNRRASFDEVLAVQVAVRTTMPPGDLLNFLRCMLPAMNPSERATMLGGLRDGAPPEVFAMCWAAAAEVLAVDELAAVDRCIGASGHVADPLDGLRHVGETIAGVVEKLLPNRILGPSPCAGWTRRDVLNHMVGSADLFSAAARGEQVSFPDWSSMPDWLGRDPVAAYRAAIDRVLDAFGAPGVLDGDVALPWGTMPAGAAVDVLVLDHVIHGWDLTAGHAEPPAFDAIVVDVALATSIAAIGDDVREAGFYGHEQQVPADATPLARLAAFGGRTVSTAER